MERKKDDSAEKVSRVKKDKNDGRFIGIGEKFQSDLAGLL